MLAFWTPGPIEILVILIVLLFVFLIPTALIILLVVYLLNNKKKTEKLRSDVERLAEEIHKLKEGQN